MARYISQNYQKANLILKGKFAKSVCSILFQCIADCEWEKFGEFMLHSNAIILH